MGTPTKTQVIDMNPEYDLNDYKFPKIKKKDPRFFLTIQSWVRRYFAGKVITFASVEKVRNFIYEQTTVKERKEIIRKTGASL